MKMIMKVSMQGPTIGLAPGDEHDFGDAEAVRLAAAGFAEPHPDDATAFAKASAAANKPESDKKAD